jgi:hypothetical protein
MEHVPDLRLFYIRLAVGLAVRAPVHLSRTVAALVVGDDQGSLAVLGSKMMIWFAVLPFPTYQPASSAATARGYSFQFWG